MGAGDYKKVSCEAATAPKILGSEKRQHPIIGETKVFHQVLRLVPKYYEDQNLNESPSYQEIKASRGQKQFQDSDVKLNQILEMFKLLPNMRFKPDGRTRYGHIRYG